MSDKSKWNVYIVETECGKLYTGITKDIERRFEEHKNSKKGAKFFRSSTPKQIVYSIREISHSQALRFEIKIKGLSKSQKLKLIKSGMAPELDERPPK